MGTGQNPHELLGRERKVSILVAHLAGHDLDTIKALTETDWARIAKLVDIKPPSAQTVARVIEVLSIRPRMTGADVARKMADPFAGLNGEAIR